MNARHVKAGGPEEVKKKEEEGLITLMKERVKDRTISIVWACRDQANAMNECLHQHTTDEVLEDLKYRWVKAGKPSFADRAKMPKF
jgi:COX assembly protein 1